MESGLKGAECGLKAVQSHGNIIWAMCSTDKAGFIGGGREVDSVFQAVLEKFFENFRIGGEGVFIITDRVFAEEKAVH
jgi:hypothetical protein